MAENNYTRQEITAMADRCYDRCMGCFRCENYEPINGRAVTNKKRLFQWVNTGCYYSYDLPWDDEHWCWFKPIKNTPEVDILHSLTWDNLITAARERAR